MATWPSIYGPLWRYRWTKMDADTLQRTSKDPWEGVPEDQRQRRPQVTPYGLDAWTFRITYEQNWRRQEKGEAPVYPKVGQVIYAPVGCPPKGLCNSELERRPGEAPKVLDHLAHPVERYDWIKSQDWIWETVPAKVWSDHKPTTLGQLALALRKYSKHGYRWAKYFDPAHKNYKRANAESFRQFMAAAIFEYPANTDYRAQVVSSGFDANQTNLPPTQYKVQAGGQRVVRVPTEKRKARVVPASRGTQLQRPTDNPEIREFVDALKRETKRTIHAANVGATEQLNRTRFSEAARRLKEFVRVFPPPSSDRPDHVRAYEQLHLRTAKLHDRCEWLANLPTSYYQYAPVHYDPQVFSMANLLPLVQSHARPVIDPRAEAEGGASVLTDLLLGDEHRDSVAAWTQTVVRKSLTMTPPVRALIDTAFDAVEALRYADGAIIEASSNKIEAILNDATEERESTWNYPTLLDYLVRIPQVVGNFSGPPSLTVAMAQTVAYTRLKFDRFAWFRTAPSSAVRYIGGSPELAKALEGKDIPTIDKELGKYQTHWGLKAGVSLMQWLAFIVAVKDAGEAIQKAESAPEYLQAAIKGFSAGASGAQALTFTAETVVQLRGALSEHAGTLQRVNKFLVRGSNGILCIQEMAAAGTAFAQREHGRGFVHLSRAGAAFLMVFIPHPGIQACIIVYLLATDFYLMLTDKHGRDPESHASAKANRVGASMLADVHDSTMQPLATMLSNDDRTLIAEIGRALAGTPLRYPADQFNLTRPRDRERLHLLGVDRRVIDELLAATV